MKKLTSKHNLYLKACLIAVVFGLAAFGATFTLNSSKPNILVNGTCDKNTVCVALKGDHAEPDAILVPVNGYAQFNSADNKIHNIAEGSGDFNHDGSHAHAGKHLSGDFNGNEGWRVQFKKKGTFVFHDHYNPKISFTVIVYNPNGDYNLKP